MSTAKCLPLCICQAFLRIRLIDHLLWFCYYCNHYHK